MKHGIVAVAALVSAANADASTVFNTSLPDLNGNFGAGVATTVTGPNGTTTTVVGPAGGANRASAADNGSWFQTDVGGGASVGITTTYLNDNGSIYFNTIDAGSKADLSHVFAAGLVPLTSFNSASFQFYRDGASTLGQVAPVLRLGIFRDTAGVKSFAGFLILDYQGAIGPVTPDNVWTTVSATQASGNFYTTNAALGPTFGSGAKSIAGWIAANSATPLYVFGVNTGVGSGWTGTFSGAVDHIRFDFSDGPQGDFDFAVAGAAVPEPQSWALLIAGLGLAGAALRRRRAITARAG